MGSHFFALFSRMKNVNRWALMRNAREESLATHCYEVAAVAHCLAVIGNRRLGKAYDPARAALVGLYHDMPEILTGDMPTPVKYFNPGIRAAFGEIEKTAQSEILGSLPADLRADFAPLISPDESTELYRLVKAADKISALIKCVEERNAGNREFTIAEESTRKAIDRLACPEAGIFLEEFMDSYSLVLDSMLKPDER